MLSAVHISTSLRPSFTWCRMLYMKQHWLQFYSKFSKNSSYNERQSESKSVGERSKSLYQRRDSDYEGQYKPKVSRNSIDNGRYVEKNKARNRERYYESQYQKRNLNYERHFEGDSKRNDMDFSRQNKENLYGEKLSRSLLGKKLFRDRDFTKEEAEAENSRKTMKTLPVSDFSEKNEDDESWLPLESENSEMRGEHPSEIIGGRQMKGGRNKKTALPKDWSETFGTLANEDENKEMAKSSFVDNERHWDELEKDKEETAHIFNHHRLARYNRRHVPDWYARRIIKLGKEGKLREAIEVFETWMIKQDRVKPTGYEFSVLIKLLSDVGYTDKAFELYYKMGELKIYVEDVIYTSLFNACSNSPYPEDALKLVKTLHTKMLVKGRHPNYITSMAMIKAYGMNGDIANAFRVADEVIDIHHRVDSNVLTNLLVACISDREAGFRHAVLVWRKFRKLGIRPDIRAYNLLLHAVDVCGIGDPILVNKMLGRSTGQYHDGIYDDMKAIEAKTGNDEETIGRLARKISPKNKSENVIKEIDSVFAKYNISFESNQDVVDEDNGDENKNNENIDETPKIECDSKDDKLIDVKVESETTINKEWWQMDIFENINTELENRTMTAEIKENEVDYPNILDPNENFSSIIHIKQIKKPQDRLALIGGVHGLLKSIENDNLKPDMKFYTALAQSAPPHLGDFIIDLMWAKGSNPDIMFYNVLIAKRTLYDKESAWALYSRLKHEEVVPNLKTFTCLSLAAVYPADGLKVLQDMEDLNLQPNKYILTALLKMSRITFNFMKTILIKMDEWDIKPDMHFIKAVEKNIERAKKRIIFKECGEMENDERDLDIFKKGLENFIEFYDNWAKKNRIEVQDHPWKHYMEKK